MPGLEIRDLAVAAGGRDLVDGVDLALRPGELVGLIGPNGAGKSTVLRAAVGILPRRRGEVLLEDRPLSEWPARQRAQRLAYLPQERRVNWNLRVRDVVGLGRYPHGRMDDPEARAAIRRALARVDAAGLAARRFGSLSGGEKALVLLARLLAVDAPLMLADEPIAGLDPYHQLQVMEVLRDVTQAGRGLLIVLHDLALAARFCDRLALMDRGRVQTAGPPPTVLTDEWLGQSFRIAVRRDENGVPLPWSRISS